MSIFANRVLQGACRVASIALSVSRDMGCVSRDACGTTACCVSRAQAREAIFAYRVLGYRVSRVA